jgi:hypothetical protein
MTQMLSRRKSLCCLCHAWSLPLAFLGVSMLVPYVSLFAQKNVVLVPGGFYVSIAIVIQKGACLLACTVVPV